MSGPLDKVERSVVLTVLGITLLFALSIAVVLVAPTWTNKEWTEPVSEYQRQMYEVADPNVYISVLASEGKELQNVTHLKQGENYSAYVEGNLLVIVAPENLKKYVTRLGDKTLKLSSKVLFLREPINSIEFSAFDAAEIEREKRAHDLERGLSTFERRKNPVPKIKVLELYDPNKESAFCLSENDGITENWTEADAATLVGEGELPASGTLFVKNPQEYRIAPYKELDGELRWRYDPKGKAVENIEELRGRQLGFVSRKELIAEGERLFAADGCFYCHTDQTRTLVQDVVLNGLDYPAPPSTPGEYVYDRVTFPGTRRIGLDLSRVGAKRPFRDWHMAHFWSPKTKSVGSIMPAFRYYFDNNPSGSRVSEIGIPNHRFEAMYQYLMTKGTRITPPSQAWWLGKDPIRTIDIIEGRYSPKGK